MLSASAKFHRLLPPAACLPHGKVPPCQVRIAHVSDPLGNMVEIQLLRCRVSAVDAAASSRYVASIALRPRTISSVSFSRATALMRLPAHTFSVCSWIFVIRSSTDGRAEFAGCSFWTPPASCVSFASALGSVSLAIRLSISMSSEHHGGPSSCWASQ